MINFDSLTLKALIQEVLTSFISGRVQKVQQPSRKELLLSIRSQGHSYKLYISIDPKYPHLSVLTSKGEEYRHIQIPQKPPMFCMLLRKYMEGAKIVDIRQPNYERILEIYFDSYNELGERVPLVLSIELMGKHSNIILYNYDTNVIIGSAHNVGEEKSREREVAGGLPYIYPPKSQKLDLLTITKDDFYQMSKVISQPLNVWANLTFHHVSLALAGEICKTSGINIENDKIIATSVEKIYQFYDLLKNALEFKKISPAISLDNRFYSLISVDARIKWQNLATVNEMVDLYFGYHINFDKVSRLKTTLSKVVKKELSKNKTKLTQHLKTIDSDEKTEKYRQTADIIMANLYEIRTGMESFQAQNPYNENKPEIITLDSALSPNANAQRYYKLYNKAKNAARISKEIIEQLNEEKIYLESIIVALEQAESMSLLEQIQDELVSQNLIKPLFKEGKKQQKEKIEVEQLKINGHTVYIGKNNKQNDYIVSKISSAEDVWLHTQNIPGSHVLIKSSSEAPEISDETLFEAAKLAVYHSQARNSSKVPVIYTKRKFLKKPPCAKPGYVTYSHEKTIFV